MIRIGLSSGEPLQLKPSPNRKFTGLRIPGSILYSSDRPGQTLHLHLYQHQLYTITLRQFYFTKAVQIITNEPDNWLRLEVPLSGRLSVKPKDGKVFQLDPGTYQLTDQPFFSSDHVDGASSIYFTIHFSPELLAGIGYDQSPGTRLPGTVPRELLEIYDILKMPLPGIAGGLLLCQ